MLISNGKIAALATFVTMSTAPYLHAAPVYDAPASMADGMAMVTDGEIADIIQVYNQKELATSELAQRTAVNQKLIAFANTMVKEHTRIQSEFGLVLRQVGVTEQSSKTSDDLRADQAAQVAELQGLQGADFDKAYLKHQIFDHQLLLNTLDQSLIPSAKIVAIKSYLQALRGDVAKYIEAAVALKPDVGE